MAIMSYAQELKGVNFAVTLQKDTADNVVDSLILRLEHRTYGITPSRTKLILDNHSLFTVTIGQSYFIQRYTDNLWKDLPLKNNAFDDMAYVVRPNSLLEFDFDFTNITVRYSKGLYRIGKTIRIRKQEDVVDTCIYAEFKIE